MTAHDSRGYKIASGSGAGLNRRGSAHLTVPWWIVESVPPGTRFVPELHEQGILYRRVDPNRLPTWAGGKPRSTPAQ